MGVNLEAKKQAQAPMGNLKVMQTSQRTDDKNVAARTLQSEYPTKNDIEKLYVVKD